MGAKSKTPASVRNFDVEVELTIVCLNQARKAQIPSEEIWRVVHRAATMRMKPIAVQGFSSGNHALRRLTWPAPKNRYFSIYRKRPIGAKIQTEVGILAKLVLARRQKSEPDRHCARGPSRTGVARATQSQPLGDYVDDPNSVFMTMKL